MDTIALKEKKKYDRLWDFFPEYREYSPADILAPLFIDFFQDQTKAGDSIIDFGCGTGRSSLPLLKENFKVSLVDFCENCLDTEIFLKTLESKDTLRFIQGCLWDLPDNLEQAEWIICFDVLEHIPEEKVDLTFKQMASRMKKGGLLSIALFEDGFGKDIGETLHVSVKPAEWWREKMAPYFSITKEFTTYKDLEINPEGNLVCAIAPTTLL